MGAGLVMGLAIGIGVVVAVLGLLRTEPEPIALQRPAAGQVRADYLPDGTPVWVIGHEDGTVDVLSGFDAHTPSNLGKLLWWCPEARGLDNPVHGSKWDEYGFKIDGPAPSGLPSWEVSLVSSRVLLGAPRVAPPIGAPIHGPPSSERQWCSGVRRRGHLPHLRRLGTLGLADRGRRVRAEWMDPAQRLPRCTGWGGSALRHRWLRRLGHRRQRRATATGHAVGRVVGLSRVVVHRPRAQRRPDRCDDDRRAALAPGLTHDAGAGAAASLPARRACALPGPLYHW
jgi:hypothetical protein